MGEWAAEVEVATVDAALAPGAPAALVIDLPQATAPSQAVRRAQSRRRAPSSYALAQGVAAQGAVKLDLLDAALATWTDAHLAKVRAEPPGVPPCDGLPPVEPLGVPPAGRVIGLRHPAEGEPTMAGDLSVHPVGTDGRWWHVHAAGDGVVAFTHGDGAPPTRFAVHADLALFVPPGRAVSVPRGGVAVVDLGAPIVHAEVVPDDVVRVEPVGTHLLVMASASGLVQSAAVLVRTADAAPESLRIELGAPPLPDPRDVVVPVGHKKRITVDAPLDQVWVADPALVEAEVQLLPRGRSRVVLTGLAPGRTALVFNSDQGPLPVPIAVGG
ncbi:MAG: pilus assembly protein N-terminal domain-containing protein [Myxococcota bacterium]